MGIDRNLVAAALILCVQAAELLAHLGSGQDANRGTAPSRPLYQTEVGRTQSLSPRKGARMATLSRDPRC